MSGPDLPGVLALNNAAVPNVNALTPADLDLIFSFSRLARVVEDDGDLAGFLIVLPPGVAYASINYRWFSGRYDSFAYVDRVVVAPVARGSGVGRRLYEDLVDHVRREGWAERVACEVNLHPPNPVSMRFHEAMGFVPVGTQPTEGGSKQVQLMSLELPMSSTSTS